MTSTEPAPTRDRRRRAERDAIVKAAFGLIGRTDGEPVSVHQILAACGLSTRAFYRHFASKDALIITMCRREADRVVRQMAAVAEAAGDPAAALEACIRYQLGVIYDVRRARQTSVLTSPEARAADGFERANIEAANERRALVADLIRAGMVAGDFSADCDADEDARAVTSVVNGLIQASLAGADVPTWDAATAHVTNLFLRSFGARSA